METDGTSIINIQDKSEKLTKKDITQKLVIVMM